jgi:hypothetical protein
MDQVAVEQRADVLRGVEVEWDRRPHRLSAFEVDAAAGVGSMGGGSWADGTHGTDVARVSVDAAPVSGPIATARVDVAVRGRSGVDPRDRVPAVATGLVPVDLPADARDAAAWLAGFAVRADPQHPDGFTVDALAIHLDPPRRGPDGGWVVPYRVELDGGPVPDRVQALGDFGADVALSVVVAPADPGAVDRRSLEGRVDAGPGLGDRRAPEVLVDAPWTDPGAVVGLSGFALDLGDGPFSGRYLRRIAVEIGDPDDRVLPVRLGFDNAGSVDRPVHARLEADVTALRAS